MIDPNVTKATVAAKSGWKAAFWIGVGEAVAYLSQNIAILQLPPKYQCLVPFIGIALGIIGKMVASYIATPEV